MWPSRQNQERCQIAYFIHSPGVDFAFTGFAEGWVFSSGAHCDAVD